MPVSRGPARLAGAALVVLQLLALAAPAAAAPIEKRHDRVDHWTTFTWDADTGTFPPDGTYTAGSRITLRDRVRFAADAKPRHGAPVGERLLGKLKLRLLDDTRPVRYEGTFTFKVQWIVDEELVVFHRAAQEASFTLRPRPGQRTKILRFLFDLEADGQYEVNGRFRTASN